MRLAAGCSAARAAAASCAHFPGRRDNRLNGLSEPNAKQALICTKPGCIAARILHGSLRIEAWPGGEGDGEPPGGFRVLGFRVLGFKV